MHIGVWNYFSSLAYFIAVGNSLTSRIRYGWGDLDCCIGQALSSFETPRPNVFTSRFHISSAIK